MNTRSNLRTVSAMARLLGVKSAWLREECEAGRIPHVKAGEQYLFDPEAVESVLLKRAQHNPEGGGDA